MNDETGSFRPLTDFLVGGLLSITILTAPISAVSFVPKPNGTNYLQQERLHILRQIETVSGQQRDTLPEPSTQRGLHDY